MAKQHRHRHNHSMNSTFEKKEPQTQTQIVKKIGVMIQMSMTRGKNRMMAGGDNPQVNYSKAKDRDEDSMGPANHFHWTFSAASIFFLNSENLTSKNK